MKNQQFDITGEIFTRVETLGGERYVHTGFRDPDNAFQNALEQIAPEVGDTIPVRLTVEILTDSPENGRQNR